MEPTTVKRQKLSIMATNPNEKASTSTETLKDSYNLYTSRFEELEKKSWYVDKTLFIKAVFEETPGLLISAPRRFGKSTNMNMLKKFLELEVNEQGLPIKDQVDEKGDHVKLQNRILFENKKIYEEEQLFKDHFGCYPVIYVDFKGVCGNSYEEVLNEFRTLLHVSFREHMYLKKSKLWLETEDDEISQFIKYLHHKQHKKLDEEEIKTGLKYLSYLLYEHFNKKQVYVLIDEYDAPVSNAIYNERISTEEMRKIIWFIQSLISETVKSNEYVCRSLMNACHHVGDVLSVSANNIKHYPFLSAKFCRFYGFTESQVAHLLKELSLEQINNVKEWYNGYSATDTDGRSVEIYSNWSILNYLDDGKIDSYWASNVLCNFKEILLHDKMKEKIQELVCGKGVSITYKKKLSVEHVEILKKLVYSPSSSINGEDVDLFIQFLYENGYLNAEFESKKLNLKIPNMEIRNEFSEALFSLDFFIRHYNFKEPAMNECIKLLKCISASQNNREESLIQLAKGIKNLYRKSPMVPQREFEFQAHLFYILQRGFPKIKGEAFTAPNRKLRCDIAVWIEEENTGIIFELKLNREDSESALKQILEKKYYTIFAKEPYGAISNTILIGLHMSECKEITISYLINNIDVNNMQTVSSRN